MIEASVSFSQFPKSCVDSKGISRECGTAMCEKCKERDDRIERYQQLAKNITDERTADGIKVLVAELKAQRAVLHREEEN